MSDLKSQVSPVDMALWLVAYETNHDSMKSLAAAAKATLKVTYSICRRLSALGWMVLKVDGCKTRPYAAIPHATQEKMARILEEEYEAAPNKGEFLMKCILHYEIQSDEYIDNARLPSMKNTTGESLELDRYYPKNDPKSAYEYNGVQHLGNTEKYNKDAQERQSRDTRKFWLCRAQNIKLIRIYAGDLHPDVVRELIPGNLPRRFVDRTGPYYRKLCELCERYIYTATQVDVPKIMSGKVV